MKPLSCLLLGILLVFSLCACQKAAPSSGEAPDQQAITEEATGVVNAAGDKSRWGKLKSGRGWICLDYAEKIG